MKWNQCYAVYSGYLKIIINHQIHKVKDAFRSPRLAAQIQRLSTLSATDLTFWNWPNPAYSKVDGDGDDTNDPEGLCVVGAVVAENDGKDDTTKVTHGTGEARDDTVGMRVNVRDQRVVETVGTLKEEGNTTTDETNQCWTVVGVGDTDDNQEDAHHDRIRVKENLLGPHGLGTAVDIVTEDTTKRTEDDVHETKHGSPVTGSLKAELGEVLEVVVAKDAVDGKLRTECAEIAGSGDESGG